MIATCTITTEPLEMFLSRWPRNFAVAFAIEVLVAQPIARFVMLKMHQYADKKNSNQSQVKQNSQNKTSENVSEANENEKEDNKIKETNENLDENKKRLSSILLTTLCFCGTILIAKLNAIS